MLSSLSRYVDRLEINEYIINIQLKSDHYIINKITLYKCKYLNLSDLVN